LHCVLGFGRIFRPCSTALQSKNIFRTGPFQSLLTIPLSFIPFNSCKKVCKKSHDIGGHWTDFGD
jgi:hypothetical protein